MALSRLFDSRGQGTVEFAIAMPVLLAIAAICLNAMIFLGDCTMFDRTFRQAVRAYAVSPAYGQSAEQACGQISAALQRGFSRDDLSAHVGCESAAGGHLVFTATLDYPPTFFGYSLDLGFLGISLPHATHSDRYAIDSYKPGVVI